MFTLGFKTDNDAFLHCPEAEISRILIQVDIAVWNAIEAGETDVVGGIRDINGNTIGSWRYKGSED